MAVISRSSDIHGRDNFPSGCAFSPDGTCVLTATASDGKFRLYNTPYRHLTGRRSDTDNCSGGVNDEDIDEKGEHDVDDPSLKARPQHECNAETPTCSSQNCGSLTDNNAKDQQKRSDTTDATITTIFPPHPWKASLTSHQGGKTARSSYSFMWSCRFKDEVT